MSNVSLIDGHIDETTMQNDMRDILVELLEEAEGQVNNDIPSLEMIADYLVANGVVPVVHCKDCKHYKAQKQSINWKNKKKYCCRVVALKVNENDYCSYGERKCE